MHTKSLWLLTISLLAADVVVASLCRPRRSDTSSAASLTTSSIPTSSTIESLSSTESISTTGSAASTAPSFSSTASSSVDLVSTPATIFTTAPSSDSTAVEASTSAPSSTTSTSPYDPIPTFMVVAVGGPVSGAVLKSTGQDGHILTFNPTYSGTRVLSFSLEHNTGRLRESNGKYMCLSFSGGLSVISVCGSEVDGMKFLTCMVMTDLTLSCSGPDGHRYTDDEGEQHIYETGATVDHLYVAWQGQRYYSFIGGANVAGGGLIAVRYGLEQVN